MRIKPMSMELWTPEFTERKNETFKSDLKQAEQLQTIIQADVSDTAYKIEQEQKQHYDAPVEEIHTSLDILPGDDAVDFKQEVFEISKDGTMRLKAKVDNKESLRHSSNKGLDIFQDTFETTGINYSKLLG